MNLLESLRSLLCKERGCVGLPRGEIDQKADRREEEINKAQERIERLLKAEEDLFKQGRQGRNQ